MRLFVQPFIDFTVIVQSRRYLLLIFIVLCCPVESHAKCQREGAKVVRNIIQKQITPLLDDAHVVFPRSCPLSLSRDIYRPEEDNKIQETLSQWRCDMCGKTFYEERFLNTHFDNRHPELYRESQDTICLADFCDIFRCDVISGHNKPKYWDQVLCNEEELSQRREKCEELMKGCIPSFLIGGEKRNFEKKLHETICGNLNCNKFWNLPEDEHNSMNAAIYVCVAMLFGVALAIYYYIVYTHFYTDESILDDASFTTRPHNNSVDVGPNQNVRRRAGYR